jgi:hypothetical protein
MIFYERTRSSRRFVVSKVTSEPTWFTDRTSLAMEHLDPATTSSTAVLVNISMSLNTTRISIPRPLLSRRPPLLQIRNAPLIRQLNHPLCLTLWYRHRGAPFRRRIAEVDNIQSLNCDFISSRCLQIFHNSRTIRHVPGPNVLDIIATLLPHLHSSIWIHLHKAHRVARLLLHPRHDVLIHGDVVVLARARDLC